MENEIMETIVEETMENQDVVETVVKSSGFGKGLVAGGLIAGAVYGVNKLIKYFKARKEFTENHGEFKDLKTEDESEDVTE